MTHLKQLQNNFQQYLMAGQEEVILAEIVPDERFSAAKRLRVYYDAYRIRLIEILKLDFPMTHTLLGDDQFDECAARYLAAFPSTHFSVRYFGQHFHPFLATTAPYQDFPIFAEMALFEWSLAHTLDAADAPMMTVEDLSAIPMEDWPAWCFSFHPSVISQTLAWDAPQLWREIDEERPPRMPSKQDKPVRWLFWRKDVRCFFQSCSAIEEILYQAILAGNNFSEICEALLDVLPEDQIPLNAAQVLHKWVGQGMMRKIGFSAE